MRTHKMKMNPRMCTFRVRSGNFLGFLVHKRGVEVDKNKARLVVREGGHNIFLANGMKLVKEVS